MGKTIVPSISQTGKRSALSYCPHCSKSLIIFPGGSSPGPDWRQMAQFESTQGGDGVPSAGDWQKVTPVGRLNTGDVTTAIYDAFVSCMLVSSGGAVICWYAGWPWSWSLIAGFGTALWRYFGGVHLAKSLLEIVESLSPQAPQSEPVPEPLPVPLEVIQKNKAGIIQRMFRFSLPDGVSESQFIEWSRGVLLRPDLTQARWVTTDGFIRDDYIKLLALLDESGVIKRKSRAKNAAYELTPAGRRSLRGYILLKKDTHSHSLTRHGGQNV